MAGSQLRGNTPAAGFNVGGLHRFLASISPQAVDRPTDIEDRFLERVAKIGSGVATNDHRAGLGHESREVPDVTGNNHVATFQ